MAPMGLRLCAGRSRRRHSAQTCWAMGLFLFAKVCACVYACVPADSGTHLWPLPYGGGSSPRPSEPFHQPPSQGPPRGTSREGEGHSGPAGSEGCTEGSVFYTQNHSHGATSRDSRTASHPSLTGKPHSHSAGLFTRANKCPFPPRAFFGNYSCKSHGAVNDSIQKFQQWKRTDLKKKKRYLERGI